MLDLQNNYDGRYISVPSNDIYKLLDYKKNFNQRVSVISFNQKEENMTEFKFIASTDGLCTFSITSLTKTNPVSNIKVIKNDKVIKYNNLKFGQNAVFFMVSMYDNISIKVYDLEYKSYFCTIHPVVNHKHNDDFITHYDILEKDTEIPDNPDTYEVRQPNYEKLIKCISPSNNEPKVIFNCSDLNIEKVLDISGYIVYNYGTYPISYNEPMLIDSKFVSNKLNINVIYNSDTNEIICKTACEIFFNKEMIVTIRYTKNDDFIEVSD